MAERKTCAGCLWLWPRLEAPDKPNRVCYCNQSEYYRRERSGKCTACEAREQSVTGKLKSMRSTRKPQSKHARY